MKHTWKMHTKMLLTFGGIVLFALVMQTVLYWKNSSGIIYQQAEEESMNALENMQDDIYVYIKKIEKGLAGIYNEQGYLNDLKACRDIGWMRERYYREAYQLASGRFDASDGVAAVYLYNGGHELVSFYRRAVTPKYHFPKDIYEDPEVYNAQAVLDYVSSDNARMLISSYYNKSRGKNVIRFALKIYESSNIGKKIGYIVCDVNWRPIQAVMQKYVVNEEAAMWLQPVGDRPVMEVGKLNDKNRKDCEGLQQKIAAGETYEGAAVQSGDCVFFQVGQSKYNLGAYALMPESFLKKSQKALAGNFVCIAALMLFLEGRR